MTLFRRDWAITIGSLQIPAPLRLAFKIEKTVHHSVNKATAQIFNLRRDHQAQIEEQTGVPVLIAAGYREDLGRETIFAGELHRAHGGGRRGGFSADPIHSDRQGADVITHIEAVDAGQAYRQARVSQSFGPGVSAATVIRACVTALGVGVGNLETALSSLAFETGGASFDEGTVLDGQASRELTRLLESFGLRWCVQHGALQVTRRGEALQTQALRLSPETGLLGSPEIGTHGRIKIRALLTPELSPGRRVVVSSERLEGRFEVRSVTYEGDSHGDTWEAQCELAPEGAAP